MMRFSPAHAALLGASIIVACSSTSQSATQQATPAPVPATPTYPPIPSMSQMQQANCAQPGASVTYYDAKTGQPIVIGSNEYIQYTLPLGSSIATATAWVIAQVNNHSQRRIAYPRAPMIVGEISQSIHSASTIEVLCRSSIMSEVWPCIRQGACNCAARSRHLSSSLMVRLLARRGAASCSLLGSASFNERIAMR